MFLFLHSLLLHLWLLVSNTQAYTWKFRTNPKQCSKLSVEIEGSNGQAPFNMLIIPHGPSPGQFETRTIQTISFNSTDDGDKNLDFTLNYPSGSELVAVVSDRNGFATGGTSDPWRVQASNDNSCFDNTKTIRPKWPFFYLSTDGLRSCEASRVSWNTSNPNITGEVNFVGVIPHGTSFNITSKPLYNVPNNSTGTTGFDFTPPVNPGTSLILVSGDEGATGTGGFVAYLVGPPQDPARTNCVPNMPSVTAGLPAGGDPSVDLDAQKSTNTGAIVGGVLGAVAFLVCVGIVVFLLMRRRNQARNTPHGPPPVNGDHLSFHPTTTSPIHEVTPFSQLEPHPPPRSTGEYTSDDQSRITAMPVLSPNRKYHNPPVNYVRHTDAEDIMMASSSPPQTVDLPPVYNPARAQQDSSRSSTSGGGPSPPPTGDRKVRPAGRPELHTELSPQR